MFLDDKIAPARVSARATTIPFWMPVVAIAVGAFLLGGSHTTAAAAGLANSVEIAQTAGGFDQPIVMGMLMLGFAAMAVAGRAMRRRTIKDYIATESRRRFR